MSATGGRDGADWRARINPEERALAVNLGAEEEMILARTLQWQRLEKRIVEGRLGPRFTSREAWDRAEQPGEQQGRELAR